MRSPGTEPPERRFEQFDTKLRFDYIDLYKLSGLIGLVLGRTSTKKNEASECLPRTLVLATARSHALRAFAFAAPNTEMGT